MAEQSERPVVVLQRPQFERPSGWSPVAPPPTPVAEWFALAYKTYDELLQLGLGRWGGHWNGELFLLPAEWLDHIPEGFPVTSISEKTFPFARATADDDRRMGLLSFGIVCISSPSPRSGSVS